jgi:hypothetical protein
MPFDVPQPDDPPDDAEPRVKAVRPPLRDPLTPPFRRLRVFAFDPLLSNQLDTRGVNQITLPVAWEDDLKPGPAGEYLEVVDDDPDGGRTHAPVDLNHPYLLAQDGLPPSEANPQFHQQMVYAVAMTTIRHFERALGRPAQWAPAYDPDKPEGERDRYVGRLRIHPHAMREPNAYYSPQQKALLFGYFPAAAAAPGRNLPGGTVYTCLSHDVVAHETTHALLDGMHRRFVEPSNPDVLALHEAFADVVALFQHFTFPDVLRQQIAQTRGDLAGQNLLGQLARQFGEAIGRGGALRDALGDVDPATGVWAPRKPDPAAYANAVEPHERGAILVAAVFDAFLSIYKSRVADLLRIATGGSGVLPAGELHPDLVNRLAREAAKSAGHVLTMCVRALDYCPPVDVTFGEYLRALVTTDAEAVRYDDRGYRAAMVEAFRRRGLYPPEVQSLAADGLRWQGPEAFPGCEGRVRLDGQHDRRLLDLLNRWNLSAGRREQFDYARRVRSAVHGWVAGLRNQWERTGWDLFDLEAMTGLALTPDAPAGHRRADDGRPAVEVHAVWPARRVGPDGQLTQNLVVVLTQSRPGYADAADQDRADRGDLSPRVRPAFTFRGGCTLVFDLETAAPKYFIRKSVFSRDRLRQQRQYLCRPEAAAMRAAYYGKAGAAEPFAVLHGATRRAE